MKNNYQPDAKWRKTAAKMPPLRRRKTGFPYSRENDEVLHWLANQPDLVDMIFTRAYNAGLIAYDRETETWKGRDA